MQRLIALERNYDVTIGVPTVLGEVFRHCTGEYQGDPVFVARHPVVISRTQ